LKVWCCRKAGRATPGFDLRRAAQPAKGYSSALGSGGASVRMKVLTLIPPDSLNDQRRESGRITTCHDRRSA